ncbi:ornithine cyclodeaminase [Cellulomonas carbonis]|uniref:Ornithine cyclodeaminase n=1 Tax=Cellulomonas carbonis T26 TaxID=947969 RepID=A0A0A0BNC5_9CELL|nr:ornithine cyclodeaminase [Cellulomonas carbonis]KGM09425.1 ornithine cyclodeaminase [Cellulomonas carbonis T26]GGB94957.1 ornithine cyclodeaminase [Cellulomonas carbonis]
MSAGRPFLYLSHADVVAAGVLDAARCVDVCEEVFGLLASGDYLMGGPGKNSHGLGLVFPASSPFPGMPLAGPDRRFVAMPAYVGGRFDVCGNKWYGSNPANPGRGLPRSVLTLTLNDKDTGEPLCLMSANAVSAARTGAIPALASRCLAPGSRVLAVIGCGVVNRAVVAAVMTQQPALEHVVLHDVDADASELMAAWVRDTYGVRADTAPTADACVAGADLVSVAASRRTPLEIASGSFADGATVLLSGPMASDDAFWCDSRVVYDHVPLHQEYVREAAAAPDRGAAYDALIGGPLYRLIDAGRVPPLEGSVDLGSLLSGRVPRPVDPDARTVVVACGMAVFDVALGLDLYTTAVERGLGRALDLWGDELPPTAADLRPTRS